MSAELKLLPCPFCGSKDIDPRGWGSTDSAGPACDDCGGATGDVGDTLEENIRLWNTRAPQWQPIESAPKDGSWVVLGRAGHGAVLLAFWHRLHGAWWGQGGDDGQWKKWKQATHWQPLPTPPEVQP